MYAPDDGTVLRRYRRRNVPHEEAAIVRERDLILERDLIFERV